MTLSKGRFRHLHERRVACGAGLSGSLRRLSYGVLGIDGVPADAGLQDAQLLLGEGNAVR